MEIQLTKITPIGEKFFHIFEMNDGSTQEVETTEENYRQLGISNPVNPTIENGIWKNSYARIKYSSTTGDIENNQYADNGDGYITKIGNYFIQTSKEEITEDKIQQSIVDEAIEKIDTLNAKYNTTL